MHHYCNQGTRLADGSGTEAGCVKHWVLLLAAATHLCCSACMALTVSYAFSDANNFAQLQRACLTVCRFATGHEASDSTSCISRDGGRWPDRDDSRCAALALGAGMLQAEELEQQHRLL